jgi:hypothetical protein
MGGCWRRLWPDRGKITPTRPERPQELLESDCRTHVTHQQVKRFKIRSFKIATISLSQTLRLMRKAQVLRTYQK